MAAASAPPAPAAIARTVGAYRRLLREAAGSARDDLLRAGERVGARLGRAAPDLVEELDGIAAGAGQDVRELLADQRAHRAARRRAARGECSLLGRAARAAGAWLAQTWDWHPDLAGAAVALDRRRATAAGSRP